MKPNPALFSLALLGIAVLVPHQLVRAQSTSVAGEEPVLPWYRTEIIVFQHLQQLADDDEVFTPPTTAAETEFALLDSGPINAGEDRWMDSFPSRIGELGGTGAPDSDQRPGDTGMTEDIGAGLDNLGMDAAAGLEFRLADIQAMELVDELQRLQGRSMYQVLAHLAWEQPGYTLEQARPFPLSEYAGAQSGLSGDVTLYRGRYLHMVFDLSMQATVSEQILMFPPSGQNQSSRYRIVEDRRMRSGELHYIDHPRFGVLLKVTEVGARPMAEQISVPPTGQ
jgi:hypothetical protein